METRKTSWDMLLFGAVANWITGRRWRTCKLLTDDTAHRRPDVDTRSMLPPSSRITTEVSQSGPRSDHQGV